MFLQIKNIYSSDIFLFFTHKKLPAPKVQVVEQETIYFEGLVITYYQ